MQRCAAFPCKQQDLDAAITSEAICRKSMQCHHVAHAQLSFQGASCCMKQNLVPQKDHQIKPI